VLHRLASLINKEIIQFVRDPVLVAFILIAPILQIVLMGRSVSQGVEGMPVAVVDYDLTPLSREIITALDNTDEIVVSAFPNRLEDAQQLVDRGDVIGMVVIPRGFMQDTRSATKVAQIQVIIDGSSSVIAAQTLSAAQSAVQSLANNAAIAATSRPLGGIRVFVEALFNPTLSLRPDSIISEIALITFEVTILVAVMGIVREREIGTLEMLSITPLRRLELLAGKAITPMIVGMINFLLMFVVVRVVFDIPMRGSFLALLGLTVLYLGAEVAYALLISTLTQSQQQATTVVFVWAIACVTLSGFLVPITTLPKAMQWISWAVPLRHYLASIRSIMLKGTPIAALLPQTIALAVLGVVMMLLTTRTLSRVTD